MLINFAVLHRTSGKSPVSNRYTVFRPKHPPFWQMFATVVGFTKTIWINIWNIMIVPKVSHHVGKIEHQYKSPVQIHWLLVSNIFLKMLISFWEKSFPLTKSHVSRWLLHHQPATTREIRNTKGPSAIFLRCLVKPGSATSRR